MYLAKSNVNKQQGFTLIELMIVIAFGTLATTGLGHYINSVLSSDNSINSKSEMQENARFAISFLSNSIMQAGADLPQSGYYVITLKTNDTITVQNNPNSGAYQIPYDLGNVSLIKLDSVKKFKNAKNILVMKTSDGTVSTYKINFIDEINNTITIDQSVKIYKGDQIFAQTTSVYYIDKQSNLCLDSNENIISQGVDSLSVVFLDKQKKVTTQWASMKYAHIFIRVAPPKETKLVSKNYTGKNTLKFDIDFILRNKVF